MRKKIQKLKDLIDTLDLNVTSLVVNKAAAKEIIKELKFKLKKIKKEL